MMSDEDAKKLMDGMDDAVSKLYGSIEGGMEINRILNKRKADAENAAIETNERLEELALWRYAHEEKQKKSEMFNRFLAVAAIFIAAVSLFKQIAA